MDNQLLKKREEELKNIKDARELYMEPIGNLALANSAEIAEVAV